MPGSPGYNENPTESDKIHCLIILMNAFKFAAMDPDVEKKIQDIRAEADARRKCKVLNFEI